jgi:hypothetical protein
MMFSF